MRHVPWRLIRTAATIDGNSKRRPIRSPLLHLGFHAPDGRAAFAAVPIVGIALAMPVWPVRAQTVGPSPPDITSTINVLGGATVTVLGSTNDITTGTTRGALVNAGGVLVVDTTAGPAPGAINFQTVNGTALEAFGGIIAVPNGGLSVQTVGGHAFLANGVGSSITIGNGAAITTTGVGAALVAIGGTINATGVIVNNTATASPTISAGHGAIAESGGTINLNAGTSIATAAFNSVGLGASGAGSTVNPSVIVPVTMNGRGSMGVYLHDGGQVTLLPGSTLQMNATSSIGIAVDNTTVALGTFGSGLTINLDGVHVTGQAGSTGLVAFNGASVAIENLTVTGVNAAAGVWARPNSSITVSGNSVINIAAPSNPTYYTLLTANLVTSAGPVGSIFGVTGAIPAAGLKSDAGLITSIGTTVNLTGGNGAAGVNTTAGGVVDMTSNTISATGSNSFGVRVDSGQVIGRDSSVTTSGGGAALFFNFGPGVIDLTNTAVLATGSGTTGLASLNGTANATNVVRLSGGSLVSTDQTAIQAQGPLDVTVTNGAVVTGGGGFLVQAFDQSAFFPQPTFVRLDASGNSILTGNAMAAPLSRLDISLSSGAQWTGAAFDVTNVAVNPTGIWNVTADSNVTNQVANAGLIAFTPPAGGVFKTLTTFDYVGQGGTLGLNTFLGTDGSPSDVLVIDGGTATGSSAIRVTNAGGPGALITGNGILVVNTINGGTTQPGLFRLAFPVVAGPYEYTLHRSSVDASNPQAWYLRNTLDCTSPFAPSPPCPAPVPPGPTPPGPTPPPIPHYRAETSIYAAMPAMTLLYGRNLMDTLHERVGEEEDLRGRLSEGRFPRAAWGRLIGMHGERDGAANGIYGHGPHYEYDFFGLQVGHDFYRKERQDGSRDHAGLYFAIGHADGNVSHFDRSRGSAKFNGYSLGGYWTHFGPTGWYLDAVAQGTWYDATAHGKRGIAALKTDGFGFAGSLEGGHPFKLGNGFFVEPQAQIVYQWIELADGRDIGALVRFSDVESLAGRVGLRVGRTFALDPGPMPRQVTAWLRPNLWHEFRGDPKTEFSSATGFVPFRAHLGGSWIEINAGISGQIDPNTTLFVNASYHTRFEGNSFAYTGKAGFRLNW